MKSANFLVPMLAVLFFRSLQRSILQTFLVLSIVQSKEKEVWISFLSQRSMSSQISLCLPSFKQSWQHTFTLKNTFKKTELAARTQQKNQFDWQFCHETHWASRFNHNPDLKRNWKKPSYSASPPCRHLQVFLALLKSENCPREECRKTGKLHVTASLLRRW